MNVVPRPGSDSKDSSPPCLWTTAAYAIASVLSEGFAGVPIPAPVANPAHRSEAHGEDGAIGPRAIVRGAV